MNKRQRFLAAKLAERLLGKEESARMQDIKINDIGFGYDQFGMEREAAILAYAVSKFIYDKWFRVESHGHANVPKKGRAIIVPNHSGVLPIDAAMIGVDLIKELDPPRTMRAMVDNFMGFLPFVNTLFYRVGQMVGHLRNFEVLLENEEMVAVFPEGARGTGKLFHQRYKLLPFNVGFVELALRFKAPIIPTAVIGAEEQAPMLYDFKPLARALRFPYFPITPLFPWIGPLGIVPLPVKYHIYYGEPIKLYEEYGAETIDDPEKVRMLAERVQLTVQRMIDEGLKERESIFGLAHEMDPNRQRLMQRVN
ncbi:MAG: lysophospholipid acyltransferase family protein [Candidatus Alcyoniella australis]|nr:lysophospholipid acyltransferase family protein [Candidatus Alcyoniella australis]